MAWIQSECDLENHPKAILLRGRMGWSKNETVGFLHRFWWQVLKYAPSGCVSALSLEVVSGTLDMKLKDLTRAVEVMSADDVRLIDCRDGKMYVHDWIDYAGSYLRDTLYRRKPEAWRAVKALYDVSADSRPTVGEQSAVPTDQQTYPLASADNPDPANRMAAEVGIAANVGQRQLSDLRDLIAIDGYEAGMGGLRHAIGKGIGPPACIAYAAKMVAGNKAKRDINGAATEKRGKRFQDN